MPASILILAMKEIVGGLHEVLLLVVKICHQLDGDHPDGWRNGQSYEGC